jgi:hypothetical protein
MHRSASSAMPRSCRRPSTEPFERPFDVVADYAGALAALTLIAAVVTLIALLVWVALGKP